MASNPYDDMSVTGLGGGAQSANPYDQMDITGSSQIKANVVTSMGTSPDVIARQKRLAEYVGYTPAMGNAIPEEVAQMAAIKEVSTNASTSPVLQKRYTDAEFMALAHDDSGPLSAIASAAKWLVNAPDAPAGGSIQMVRALASGAPRLASGLWGAAAAVGGIGDQITQSIDDAAAFVTNTPRRQIVGTTGPETFFLAQQKTAQNTAANVMGMSKDAGFVEKAAMSGLQSAGQSLLLAPLGLAQSAGNTSINALLGVMGVSTGGESYGKARAAGVSPFQAAAYGIEDAVAEVVTEKYLGIAGFLKNVKAGASAAKLFGYEVVKEVPGEIGATLWQNFNEWMNVNPGKPIVDFVSEQPAAIAETIIATLVGGGSQIGIVRGIDRLIDPDQTERKSQQAEQHASVLEAMQTTMQASKLLERSPETLTSYAQDLVDEGTPNVYLDSAKLVEAGVDLQALAQVMPSLATQLDQAKSGADLVVPTGEFLAGSLTEAGSVFSQPLVEHARTDADGMSRADAKVYMAEKGDALNAEIERVLKEHESDTEFKAGRDQVQAEILTQLNEVKRFTSAVNTQYATLAANFYAVMAARSGMTVPQFAQTYQLGFSGQTQAGAQVLDQKVLNDLSETVFKPQTQADRDAGYSNRFKNPITLKDGTRLSGFTDPAKQTTFHGYDKNGEQITIGREYVKPEDIVSSRDSNRTADKVRAGLTLNEDSQVGATTLNQGEVRSAQSPYENDLFGNPLPAPTGRRGSAARRAGAEAGDVQPTTAVQDTQAPPGEYHVRTVVGSETQRKLGASQITTASELAQATAYLYRSAVERFDGIVTDAAGKPLGVIGGFKGAIAQTSVYPGTLVAEAVRIPGAAHVWFSHNHPSGSSELSNADLNLAQTLVDVFNGSGIEPMGLMAVSGKEFSFTTGGLGILDRRQSFDAPTTEVSVPVIEREQVARENELVIVTSPDSAKRIAAEYYAQAKAPGIILLTSQNHVAAWVPLQPEMLGKLRDTGGLNAIYRAISESNSGAAIIVHGGELSKKGDLPSGTISTNIAAALSKADVRTLDSINAVTMESAAEQGTNLVANTLQQDQRGQIAFANDITQQASIISMFKAADLSTFIHEGGHFFLEVQADLAAKISARISQGETVTDGERSIVDDFNTTLTWMGVKGSPELSSIDTWYLMTADEKRPHHEQWARGFEAYAFEGKSPSIELTNMFQTFRSWLVNVYRSVLKTATAGPADISQAMSVELSDEVRAVMDRMLASTEQIQASEAARNMGPLFTSAEEAGMDLEAYQAYHEMGTQSTMDAIDELQAKGLKDMQWLSRARARKLKELQKRHKVLRAQIAREVRAEVMSQPIYRAWTFLTAKAGDQLKGDKPAGQAKGVNPAVDNIFTAIAKLGGLNRAEVKSQWGIDEKEKLESGVFGSPVVRKEGGRSMDAMAEYLVEEGYIIEGRNDQTAAEQLAELFDDQRRGTDRYSITHDMQAAYGDQPLDIPDLPEMGFGKLRTEDLRNAYGIKDDAIWRKLSELRMTSDETGLNPEIVAELFEFGSADELVRKLLAAEPPKSAIEGRTDQRMLEEHGDLATPAGLERAADMAIHNDARVRFVAAELRALQHAMAVREKQPGKKNTVDVLVAAAKEYGNTVIARLKVRDIRPAQYAAAEVRAGKAAVAAKGDLPKQAEHKRNQLVNMYATKAAYAAQEEVKKAIEYFKKFDKASKTLDPQYRMQIEALLERFDLRASTSLKAIDKRKALIAWVAELEEEGLAPDIPDSLLQEANRKSFKEMTVEEVRGLRDSIKQIEHLGKLKALLLTAKDNRDFATAVAEIAAGIEAHDKGREANTRTSNTNTGKAIEGMKNFWASHIKVATWARAMDGGKDGGPVWEYLVRTANSAGDTEVVMREKATKELAKLVAPVLAQGPIHQRFGKGTFFPSLGKSLNKEAILAMALNMGNASNMQRLLGGEGWNAQQIKPALDTLSAADWNFVQSVWDHFESYRPLIGAKEMRVYGREPVWIDAQPLSVQTSDGQSLQLRGGYYPVKFDPRASGRAEEHAGAEAAKAQLKGAYTSATTRRSFTKERVEEVNGRPLLLSLDGIYNGVQEVIHDLTWHEWLIDANKLLKNKAIDQAIRGAYGPDVVRQFKKWTEDIAAGDSGINTALEAASAFVRQGVSVSGLGLNIMSALMQPLGITQSIVRIGPKWVGRGISKAIGSPLETTDTVNEKSEFMRTRSLTRLREMAEVRTQVKGQSKVRSAIDSSAYFLMMRCQQLVDVPTWWGAYEKAIAEGNGEDRAVALSDQAVIDSQGSGGTKDLSAIERGGPTSKLFTTFYSFFNTALNLGVGKTMTHTDKTKLAADYLLLYVVPVMLGAALKDALTPGDSGDWDDEEHILKKLIGEQISFMLGLMAFVRETTGAVQAVTGTTQYAGGYGGPAGLRPVGDLVKLGVQVNQGEMDDGLRKAIINTASQLLRLPGAQVNRTINGAEALMDGRTQNPGALLTGYQEPH